MYFKKTDIQAANNFVMTRTQDLNVILGTEDTERFKKVINNIRKSKQYYEGEKIDTMHFNALKSNINIAIDNLSKYLIKNVHKYKEYVDYTKPVEYLLTAVDSLYITAMEELGCPDMPFIYSEKDIKETLAKSAINIHRNYVTFDISKDDIFKQQRKKDADEVSKNFKNHIKEIENGKKAESMGKMIAEYQALKERQNNHNVFWRMFHRAENKARNELLKKMDKTIKELLPEGMKFINLDEANPSEISRQIADARIRGEIEVSSVKRFDPETVSQVFGCSPETEEIPDQYKLMEEFSKKMPMSEDVNFLNDIIGMDNEKINQVSEEVSVKNDKVISKD